MPSHIIVGASRGIGYGFLEQLSKDPANTVIGLVRNPEQTQKKVDADGLKNVTILQADLTDYASLLAAAKQASSLLPNGTADYLWNNAAYLSESTANRFFDEYTPEEWPQLLEELQLSFSTNVIGIVNVINAFLPLVLKSSIKKVITLSTGLADDKLTSELGVWESAPYSASKAAANTIVAKWDARYRSQGVLFLAISPGVVYHGQASALLLFSHGLSLSVPDAQKPREAEANVTTATPSPALGAKFYRYSPNMTGPISTEQSITAMLKTVSVCTAEADGGKFYSHLGRNQGWLNTA